MALQVYSLGFGLPTCKIGRSIHFLGIAMIVGVNTLMPEDAGGLSGVYTGNDSRWFRSLLFALRGLQTETEFVLFCDESNAAKYQGWVRADIGGQGSLFSGLRGGGALEAAAAKAKVDVIWTPLAGASVGPIPQVLFATDFLPWESDGDAGPVRKGANLKAEKKACQQAKSLVVSSEYLRRKALDIFEMPLNKVFVVGPGVDSAFLGAHDTMVELPYMVIYCDARISRGVERFFEALEMLEKEYPHNFVIAGPGFAGEPPNWGDRYVRIEHLPDTALCGLYQHASVFIYPGMFDGCCVRVLEALSAGVPVVAPRGGALPEHCGDGPIYYNHTSAISLVQCVRRAVDLDPQARAARVHAGRSVLPKFSWEKSAWKLLTALSKQ